MGRKATVAYAAMPSSLPINPRCSVVVALTEIAETGQFNRVARVLRILAMWGEIFGD